MPSDHVSFSDEDAQAEAAKTALLKKEYPSPKAFWMACEAGEKIGNGICKGLETTVDKVNEMLAIGCKLGLGLCLLLVALGFWAGTPKAALLNPYEFAHLGMCFCGGLLAANFGEAALGERPLSHALTVPIVIGAILYAILAH